MNPAEFNEWRRENDLKNLFACFQKALPHFDDWLAKNKITTAFILATDNPGQFFYWDRPVYYIQSTKDGNVRHYFVPVEDEKHEKQIQKNKDKNNEGATVEHFRFTPYFLWVKQVHQVEKPVKAHYAGDMDTFRYVTGTAPDVPEACSWTIAPGFTVLKLGGTKIDGWINLNNRNLDFTNLDFLEIAGRDSWNTEINLFYSHCAHITIRNAEVKFTNFYACHFQNLRAEQSRLYGVEFHQCDIFRAYFDDSTIANLVINDCSSNNFSFHRVEVENIDYTPTRSEYHSGLTHTYETIKDNFKRFRMLYQANGLRQEASEAYYHERLYELKYNWQSFEIRKPFRALWKRQWEYGISSLKHNGKLLLKIFSSKISYLIWGFGERPVRIVLTSLSILTLYGLIYYFSAIDKLHHDVINSLYLSVVTFTTLGFGDITPIDHDGYKLLVGSEALLGAFCMGLLVAGFANKSRY